VWADELLVTPDAHPGLTEEFHEVARVAAGMVARPLRTDEQVRPGADDSGAPFLTDYDAGRFVDPLADACVELIRREAVPPAQTRSPGDKVSIEEAHFNIASSKCGYTLTSKGHDRGVVERRVEDIVLEAHRPAAMELVVDGAVAEFGHVALEDEAQLYPVVLTHRRRGGELRIETLACEREGGLGGAVEVFHDEAHDFDREIEEP
jgi:hypothetical protein